MTTVEDAQSAPPDDAGDQPAPGEPGDQPAPGQRRLRRRGPVWLVLGVVLMGVASAGALIWLNRSDSAPASGGSGPVATAVVERGTIAATQEWDGTLASGELTTVNAWAQGTVTRLPDQGEPLERGDELYRLDERPVVLLYGAVPMYRELRPGDTGADADQLAANLTELGYGGFTRADVRQWQAELGLAETGVVTPVDVVFVPEAGTVDSLRVGVGDRVSPGSPVIDLAGPEQVVNLQADVDDRKWFDTGAEVTVVLPSGAELPGTVGGSELARVQTGGGEGMPAETETVVQVEVALSEPAPEDQVGASVGVVITTDEREDVLLVPVTALLALAEGGYGLEVVAGDGATAIVPVTTGLFAGGMVEVESDEIAEGTVVGVAGR